MPPDHEFELTRALREAADSAEPPDVVELYVGGVDRGQRIRRRSTLRQTLAIAAAVVVVAAVRIPLLRDAASTASPTVVTSSTSLTASTSTPVTPTPATPMPAPSASAMSMGGAVPLSPSATAWMSAYMAQTLDSLVPADSTTATLGLDAVAAPELTASGTWTAGLSTELTTPAGTSSIRLNVQGFAAEESCPSHARAPYGDCSETPLSGGTLTVDLSFKNPVTGAGDSVWTVDWNGPDGQSVTFGESTGATHQALTVQQATALVSNSAWDRLWKALPAPCALGAMINPRATPAQLATGAGFVCATGRDAASGGASGGASSPGSAPGPSWSSAVSSSGPVN